MKTIIRTLVAFSFTTSLFASALAQPKAQSVPPMPSAAPPAKDPVVKAESPAAPAAIIAPQTREQLLEELKKANAQLAEDKKALAAVAKTDKPALAAAQIKVKADGKAINEINQKLHALKVDKKGATKPATPAAKPATPAAKPADPAAKPAASAAKP